VVSGRQNNSQSTANYPLPATHYPLFFGEVKTEVLKSFEIDKKVLIAHINYDMLKTAFDRKTVYKPLPKFPYIRRDLALLVNESVTCGDVIKWIVGSGQCSESAELTEHASRPAPHALLKSVELFDVYEGSQIEKGKKSLAFSLTFGADERTLKDEEAEKEITMILKSLSEKGIEVRCQ